MPAVHSAWSGDSRLDAASDRRHRAARGRRAAPGRCWCSVYTVFQLQRSIGNRALAKLIQRQTLEEITTASDSMTGNGDLGTIEVATRPLMLDQGGGEIHLGGSVGQKADGTLASPAEIDAEWDRIRSRLDRGGG
jgi:hypothetical protein